MAHVLLLEPNTLLAQTYAAALECDNHSVTAVHDAQAGITAADEHTPDLIIVELQLSRHNGIEFLHELRSYYEWRSIPVIVHTTLAPPHLAAAGELLRTNLGVQAVLYKPQTSLAELLRVVRGQLAAV